MVDTNSLCVSLNDALELPAGTAETFAAALKREGLMSKSPGGRGHKGGALATSGDAANLLLALSGAPNADGAADFVWRIGSFSYIGALVRPVHGEAPAIPLEPDAENPFSRILMKMDFATMLRNLIEAERCAPGDLAGIVTENIGLHATASGSYCTLRITVQGAVEMLALWSATAAVEAHTAPRLVKSAVIPFAVIRAIAEVLGPVEKSRANDGALAAVA
jgi:hypothetical protein